MSSLILFNEELCKIRLASSLFRFELQKCFNQRIHQHLGNLHHILIITRVSKCCFSFEGNLTSLIHINSFNKVNRIIIDLKTAFNGDETTVVPSSGTRNSRKFVIENYCRRIHQHLGGISETESAVENLENYG